MKEESSLGGCTLETEIADGHLNVGEKIGLNLIDSSGHRYSDLAELLQTLPGVRAVKIVVVSDDAYSSG